MNDSVTNAFQLAPGARMKPTGTPGSKSAYVVRELPNA